MNEQATREVDVYCEDKRIATITFRLEVLQLIAEEYYNGIILIPCIDDKSATCKINHFNMYTQPTIGETT